MNFRLPSRRICLGAASAAVFALLVCSTQGADKRRGRSIEFSEPKSDEVTTNLQQLTVRKDGLKQLEEDLYQPLQAFAPKSSLEGVIAPPPRQPRSSAIQSKRVQDLLERRKNWIFMTPEDLLGGPTAEEVLKGPQYGEDGREKQQLGPMERYYERMLPKRPIGKSSSQPKDDELSNSPKKSSPRDGVSPDDDSYLPSGVKESAQSLRKYVDSENINDPYSRAAVHGTLADTFGFGNNVLSKDQELEHKKYMDEYHSLVDPSWHSPSVADLNNPLGGLADAAKPAAKPATSLGAVSIPASHNGLDAAMDAAYPRLGPAELPDVNARALGQTRPAAPFPQTDVTRTGPAAPTFAAPKRAFY